MSLQMEQIEKIKVFETEIDLTMKAPKVLKILESLENVKVSISKSKGYYGIFATRGDYSADYMRIVIDFHSGKITYVGNSSQNVLFTAAKRGRF